MDATILCKLNNALPHDAGGSILNNSISYWHLISQLKERKKKLREITDVDVPDFRVVKSSSILRAVNGLTVTVAAYSKGESLLILYHTL